MQINIFVLFVYVFVCVFVSLVVKVVAHTTEKYKIWKYEKNDEVK